MKLHSIFMTVACFCVASVSAHASELTDAIDDLNNSVDAITETLRTVSDQTSADAAAEKVAEKATAFVEAVKRLQSISTRIATGTPEEQEAGQRELMERGPAIQKSISALNAVLSTLKSNGLCDAGSKLFQALLKMNPNASGI